MLKCDYCENLAGREKSSTLNPCGNIGVVKFSVVESGDLYTFINCKHHVGDNTWFNKERYRGRENRTSRYHKLTTINFLKGGVSIIQNILTHPSLFTGVKMKTQ